VYVAGEEKEEKPQLKDYKDVKAKGPTIYAEATAVEEPSEEKQAGDVCPVCGSPLVNIEGCKKCPVCGWSVCEI